MSERSIVKTWRAKHCFKLKTEMTGRPYILIETLEGEELPCLLDTSFLTIDLNAGTTWGRATELVAMLNECVRGLAFTGPD